MKIFFILGGILLVAAALMLTSCQAFYDWTRVDPEPVSDFLPHKELLKKSNNKAPFHYVYKSPTIPDYNKIYIAPIDISGLKRDAKLEKFVGNTNGKFMKQLNELTTYTRNITIEKFNTLDKKDKWFTIVDSPDVPDSYSLELSIAQITPAKGGWNIVGVAGDLTLGVGSVITSSFGYGSLTMEGRLRDNETGEIVAMFATTERDGSAILGNFSNFTWLSSAKTNAATIARYIAIVFNADNYYNLSHDFPIKWIAL